MTQQRLSKKEKFGYGIGDAASHIILDNVMLYMMFFYVDIYGIPAGFVGTMFLLARILDAVSDPCMGLIADRTRSRFGKFRPWLLFGALPFSIVCVMAYSTPAFSPVGKMAYAAVTYLLLTLLYTIVNIPYCALGGVITQDPQQRISLQSWRFVLATAGGMLSTVLMMPLVEQLGGGNKAVGFQGAIAVLSVLALLMLLFCFFTTRERLEAPTVNASLREDIRDIWQNDQWRIVALLTLFNILAVCVRGGAMMYYVTWVMGSAGAFVMFLSTYFTGNLIGSALAGPLTKRRCKVSVFCLANTALAAVSLVMFFIPLYASITMFCFIFLIGILHQLVTPIQWVMMSDTVDYGEWRNGKRLTGISFAGTLFVLKLGLALGGALTGWMLAASGYEANHSEQNSATLLSITALFTLIPALCYLFSAIIAHRWYLLTTPCLQHLMQRLSQTSLHQQQPSAPRWQPTEEVSNENQ